MQCQRGMKYKLDKNVLLVGDPSGLNCCDVVVSAVLCTIEEGAAAGGGDLDL